MKSIFLSLLITLALEASSSNTHQIKIIEKIFSEISIGEELKIWSDSSDILFGLQTSAHFKIVQNLQDANIIILEKSDTFLSEYLSKAIFVLNYSLLSEIPQSFGALFWKKGRPNIVIIQPRIEKQSITVSKDLYPYMEDRVW